MKTTVFSYLTIKLNVRLTYTLVEMFFNCDVGQRYWLVFYKVLNSLTSSWQSWYNRVRFLDWLAHIQLFHSTCSFITLRLELWDDQSKTLALLSFINRQQSTFVANLMIQHTQSTKPGILKMYSSPNNALLPFSPALPHAVLAKSCSQACKLPAFTIFFLQL